MITSALFFISYLVILPIAVMFPFAGTLAYEWLQYMPPDSVYNSSLGSLSLLMGGIALAMWAAKDKKVTPQPAALFGIFIVYAVWLNITQMTSIVTFGDGGAALYDRAWKMLMFTVVLCMAARTRQRIEAFLLVVSLAIGNFVIMGAIKTILSGGGGETVVGAGGNILGERVSFAIAVTTLIPLIRYLRDFGTLLPQIRIVRIGLDVLTLCCVISTVGCQARTGVISLAVLGAFYFVKSKKKLMFLVLVPVLIGIVYAVAPPGYFDRMNTIQDHQDASSQGRIDSWIWGWNFALAHPITGGGFHTYLMHQIGTPEKPAYLEAHNIFFETMADHGFVGLGLLFLLYIGTIMNCQSISRRAKRLPELAWAVNLGSMLQLALITFIIGSQFLHSAAQSTSYELCALSMAARGIVERRLAEEKKSPVTLTTALSAARAAGLTQARPAKVAMGYRN
jgi:probable O-glycosylation ligase (exosortase A-associated)